MLRLSRRPAYALLPLFRTVQLRHWYSAKGSDPLSILFFGSDEFSCASLKALHAESIKNPALVKSLDVVVRPSKPAGRGLRAVRERTFENRDSPADAPAYHDLQLR
jgi:hypothetical protein